MTLASTAHILIIGMSAKKIDVLVVGAGPAGLYTALFLARSGVSNIAIIAKHPVQTLIGHASGIHPRTQEILHTLSTWRFEGTPVQLSLT